jgi:exodeoxyribonuclease V alpha subunit
MTSRLDLATENPRLVVDADGLLAVFNDAGVLDPLDVKAAQTIARLLGETDDRVLLAAALIVRGTRYGHVCIRLDQIRDAVAVDGQDPEETEQLPWPDIEEWTEVMAVSPLVTEADPPLVYQEGRLYLSRYHHYERQVADLLLSRIEGGMSEGSGGPPISSPWRGGEAYRQGRYVGEAGEGLVKGAPAESQPLLTRLLGEDTRQHQAAQLALTQRVAVIAGGPGTGKTHTIAALLAALAAGDRLPTVAVAAPTGKAAARLGEALEAMAASLADARITARLASVQPSTIHRLLGWTWERGRFAHNARNRLHHDLVIVDEMSMVSLPMAAKLLEAVRDDAAVVLVGDPYQLESIEAGTVLSDIVAAGREQGSAISDHVVVLDRVHRFEEDSAIADLATAVRTGNAGATIELLRAGGDHVTWAEERASGGFDQIWSGVVDQRTRLVELAGAGDGPGALAALNELAVLCARRTGPQGVSGWGREIERALDERFTGLRWGSDWYPGRPVMITKNDYTQDLWNGDIGVCVKTGDGLRVLFDRAGGRELPPSHLGEHTTVHAMTIHKSQGSQFDEVVVVLPGEESRLLTRELLYTAVTRARTRVNLIGTEAVVRAAVERSVQRASGLGVRLSLR